MPTFDYFGVSRIIWDESLCWPDPDPGASLFFSCPEAAVTVYWHCSRYTIFGVQDFIGLCSDEAKRFGIKKSEDYFNKL